MRTHIAVVTPVLDDWQSFATLVTEISGQFDRADVTIDIVAIDDGSCLPFDSDSIALPPDSCIAGIEVLHLAVNLGHQRAIAVGLCAIAERDDIEAIVVMDSDGEDRPDDLATLLAASRRQPGHIVFAHRAKRSEGRPFRLAYFFYRQIFRLLTGRTISFGNYVLIPALAVRRLVHMPELWNNLAATIMRSKLRYTKVPTERGTRYAGRSRMSPVALIVHGLSAMSVYTDMIFVRVLIAAAAIAGLSVLGILGVAVTRFTTDLAIPGWATTAVGDLLIILLQTLVVMVATSLMMLAGRSNRPIVPIADCLLFIARREQWRFGRAQMAPPIARAVL
ncbi:MAG: glycosyltransferase [Stellaceae bacterium]